MKKTLLSLFAFALSLGMNAQSILPFNGSVMHNENATAKNFAKAAPQKADLAENQRYAAFNITDEVGEAAGIPQYTSGSCKAGMIIDSDILDKFAGSKIIAIRFGLTQSIGSTNVFAKPIVGNNIGDDIFSKSVTSTIAGWNYVTLDEPITIEKDNAFLFGFDYKQSTKNNGQYYNDECFPLAVVETSYSGTGAPFLIYANISTSYGGQGTGWYSFNGGAISIQLIVEGNNLPDHTASVSNFKSFTGMKDVVNTVDIQLLNSSKEAVSNLDYVVSIDGTATPEQHFDFSSPIARNTYGTFTANIPAISEYGHYNVSIEITKLNGDVNAESDRIATGKIGIANEVYNRNLVIEEFTTESCGNCPRVAGFLHTALSKADESRVFAVCHHTGYGTDWLTGTWDNDITSLIFGGKGTYAPAVTYNRNEYFVEGDSNKYGLVGLPTSANIITAIINEALSQQADATLTSLEAVPDETGTNLTVTVKGKCNTAYDKDAALITFYITEDNIKAHSQAGATGTFYHNHVIRANNKSWGESVNWEGNEFTATYNAKLKASWDKSQMNIVAFLNKHNASDYSDNVIENSIGASYKDATTAGIDNAIINGANTTEVARYTLDGTQVSAPVKGLNIVKMSNGKVVKVMVK